MSAAVGPALTAAESWDALALLNGDAERGDDHPGLAAWAALARLVGAPPGESARGAP